MRGFSSCTGLVAPGHVGFSRPGTEPMFSAVEQIPIHCTIKSILCWGTHN